MSESLQSDLIILYEDEHLLAIQKPANVHSLAHDKSDTALNTLLLDQFSVLASIDKEKGEAGLVQRLDFETSGCVLVAKDARSWQALRDTFKEGRIQKEYLLLVEGKVTDITISAAIGSRYRGSKKVSVYEEKAPKRSQMAETSFSLVKELDSGVSLAKASTNSGRRHQVRAHAAHAGHPLLGDSLYGGNGDGINTYLHGDEAPSFFLHASSVSFGHPITKEQLQILASLPTYCRF